MAMRHGGNTYDSGFDGNYLEVIRLLLRSGADPNATGLKKWYKLNRDGSYSLKNTPLDIAQRNLSEYDG